MDASGLPWAWLSTNDYLNVMAESRERGQELVDRKLVQPVIAKWFQPGQRHRQHARSPWGWELPTVQRLGYAVGQTQLHLALGSIGNLPVLCIERQAATLLHHAFASARPIGEVKKFRSMWMRRRERGTALGIGSDQLFGDSLTGRRSVRS